MANEYSPSFSSTELKVGETISIAFPNIDWGSTGYDNINWSITGVTSEDINIDAGINQTVYERDGYFRGTALVPTHIGQDSIDNSIQISLAGDEFPSELNYFEFNLGENIQDNGNTVNVNPFFVQKIIVSDPEKLDALIAGPLVEEMPYGYLSIAENQDFVFTYVSSQTVVWSIDGSDADQFEIDSAGVLSFEDAPSFLNQRSRNGDNIFEVDVTAQLEDGSKDTHSLLVSVKDDPSDNFSSINTFVPNEDVIRLSSGNGSNTLLSGDGRYVIDNGGWEINDRGHQLLKNRFTGEYSVIDTTKDGVLSTGDSQHVLDISSDGRYALFTIDEYGSVDLDGLPGMGGSDGLTGEPREYGSVLYRKDLIEGDVTPVNTTSKGIKVAAGAGRGVMTPDGRYVAFVSDVQLAGLEKPPWGSDEFNRNIVYRKDLETGDLIVVSNDKDGNLNDDYIGGEQLGISDDGSRISFLYQGDDLLEAPRPIEYDEMGWEISPPYWSQDLLIKDLGSGEVILASSDSDGVRLENFGSWGTGNPIAPDGNSVIFTSGGANNIAQLYSKNLIDGGLTLLSKTPEGQEGNGYSSSHGASFSSNSRFIAYQTSASNLLGGWTPEDPEWNSDLVNHPGFIDGQWKDSNNVQDIYVFDTKTGVNRRLLDNIANEFDEHIRDPFLSGDGKLISFRTDDDFMAGGIGYETYLAKSPFIAELNDVLKIDYNLFESNAHEIETQPQVLSQQAVLGDSVKYESQYRLDLTAQSLNTDYAAEAADIKIVFDPRLFGEINASDITIGGALPIANAVQINNEAGTIRIAAASLADLNQGSGISASSPLASINLDFDEEQIQLLEKNEDGSLKINPLAFQITANDQETVFSKTFTDDFGLTNREIVSLADLGGGVEVTGQDVTLYEAKVNLAQQGDGLVLGTQRVIGSDASITNLVRSGDTLTTSAEWLNVGNIEANNLSYEGLYNQNASLVSADFSRSNIASGSFIDGVFVQDARESTVLTTDIKITGEAGNVVDLGDGIVSVKADAEGSDSFSNAGKGSSNLITFQGDLNYDGRVSMKDLAYLNAGAARQELVESTDENGNAVQVASEASYARDVDADFSGKIDLADLSVLDADWGNSLHTGDEQFQGSADVSWNDLDGQGDNSTWDNDSFKDQNAIEAEDSYVGSLESPAAAGVIGADGNTTANDNDITGTNFQDQIPA